MGKNEIIKQLAEGMEPITKEEMDQLFDPHFIHDGGVWLSHWYENMDEEYLFDNTNNWLYREYIKFQMYDAHNLNRKLKKVKNATE